MDESEVLKFEQQVRPMRLSEAIRIGAKIRPQCVGYLFKDGASCALGAAYEALGGKPVEGTVGKPEYNRIYDHLYERYGTDVCGLASERNDDGASREAVANYLESQGY